MAEALHGILEYGTKKDFVHVPNLVNILKARGHKEFKNTRASLPRLRALIGSDHCVRLVLNGSRYRLRSVKFTEAVLHPTTGLLVPQDSEADVEQSSSGAAATTPSCPPSPAPKAPSPST
jgi:transcriptional regulator of met regulon